MIGLIASFVLIAHAQRAAGRQYRCSQCVGLCTVPCNKRYHTLKNYKLCHLDIIHLDLDLAIINLSFWNTL